MNNLLNIRAGKKALERVRDEGLPQNSIDVLVGASGGPKWFVLSGLDKVLISEYFRDRKQPLELLGTSAGSWRFSCFAQKDALAAHERFENGYLYTRYSEKPDAAEISGKGRALINHMITPTTAQEIIENPIMRFNLIAVRSHGLSKSSHPLIQATGMGLAAVSNVLHRRLLSPFFTRTLFHHPDYENQIKPAFFHVDDLPTERIPLTIDNLKDAVMASGSIPVVMEGVANISGAPRGIYRDGGITDYHFDMPFTHSDGLALYPHFYDRMIPGWFDKGLKWRQPSAKNCENLVLVSPSAEFVSKLPYGKIPDRNDFKMLGFEERVKYWETVVAESAKLGEAFLELVESGNIRKLVKPLNPG